MQGRGDKHRVGRAAGRNAPGARGWQLGKLPGGWEGAGFPWSGVRETLLPRVTVLLSTARGAAGEPGDRAGWDLS